MQLTNYTVPPDVRFGWVDQPNQRGTIDIIYSCTLILISSTWTVMHINVPSTDETTWQVYMRKVRWAFFLLIAPEVGNALAALQWRSARISLRQMRSIGIKHWSIVHGFFADSGGFLLCTPDQPPFPINSCAIFYLVKQKYLEAPKISREEIEDRSNADVFVKVVACIQGAYLVTQCCARLNQKLAISCLELGTVAFVFCTAISYFFWIKQALRSLLCGTRTYGDPVSQVLLEAGPDASGVYWDTPMDFVEQPGWQEWRRRSHFNYWGGLIRRPISRIPNDYVDSPQHELVLPLCIWVIISTYTAIHILAWNFSFPTLVELWLWRVSSLVTFLVISVWGMVDVLAVQPWFNFHMTLLGIWENQAGRDTFWKRWGLDGPGTASSVLYAIGRFALIAEMFASLRLMESTVYQEVNWTQYIPHL